jgi:nucleotide-binding universal stress UspA family protein
MVEVRAMKLTMVPVTDTDEGWRAVRVALTMARRFEGHVGAVFIQPHIEVEIPEFLPAVDKDLRVQLADRAREDMAARIRQAHNTFDEIAAVFEVPVQDKPPAAGAPSATLQVNEGQMSDVVRMRASVYDAVIFAHPVGKAHADWRPSVEAALFSAGRPALIAPSTDVETVGETVLVGWNRSAQSARAMIGAMPFLTRASRVVIFSIATGAKEGPSPQDAARLLSWHGVAAEVVEIPPEDGPVAETILAKGREVGADLVVIGAYSHSRFREIILGGVTQHVLRHAEVPVLMAH